MSRNESNDDKRAQAVFNPGMIDGKAGWTVHADEKQPCVDLVKREGHVPSGSEPDARSDRMHELEHVSQSPVVNPGRLCEERRVMPETFQACEDARVNAWGVREIATGREALTGAGDLARKAIERAVTPKGALLNILASVGYLPDSVLASYAETNEVADVYAEARTLTDKGSRAKTKLAGVEHTLRAARLVDGWAMRDEPERPEPKRGEPCDGDSEGARDTSGPVPKSDDDDIAADKKALKKEATRQRVATHRAEKAQAAQDATDRATVRAMGVDRDDDAWSAGHVPFGHDGGTFSVAKLKIERLPLQAKRKARGEGRRPKRVGPLLARPDRAVAPFGGPVFEGVRKAGHVQRGIVVVDVSSSMNLNPHDVDAIIGKGEAREIWQYWGKPLTVMGALQRVACGRDRVTNDTLCAARKGGANLVDAQVLYWLGQRPGPRVWISDGGTTAPHSGHTVRVCEACLALQRAGSIVRFNSPGAYLRDRPAPIGCPFPTSRHG